VKILRYQLIPLVALTACMPPSAEQQASTKVQVEKTMDALIKRQLELVGQIDDGISDATTIALALSNACIVEYTAATEAWCTAELDNERQRQLFRNKRNKPEEKIQDSLPIVLQYRAKKLQKAR